MSVVDLNFAAIKGCFQKGGLSHDNSCPSATPQSRCFIEVSRMTLVFKITHTTESLLGSRPTSAF